MVSAEPMQGIEKLSINTATTRAQFDLPAAVQAYAEAGVRGIAPWRDLVQATGAAEARRLFDSEGMTVSGLCRGGMFPAPDAAGRQAVIDDNRLAIEEAATIGAACLVLVCGGLPAGSKDIAGARSMVVDGIGAVLDDARAAGVPLAIEPLHPMYAADRNCVNTLGQALDICDRLDPDRASGLGVAIDVYHVWWDPALIGQIRRTGRDRLLAFHICDWLVPTRDILTDRGMMGDGVIDIPAIRAEVEAQGYDGLNEVEIFSSANWWLQPGEAVVQACIERHARVV
jgi:sugar phosphate isomerase/epimerase